MSGIVRVTNDNKTMPNKSPALPERIKQFREQKGLTQEELASVLSTTKASITRWEAGASKPSKLAAKALEDIGFGVIEEHETNKDSLSRLDHLSEKELMRGVVKTIKFGKKREKIVPTPYVINGPENQLDFFSKLVKLQERPGDIEVSDSYIKRLSIVKEVRGIPTAQYELEKPKETARSWSSNYGPHGWHRYVGRFPPHLVRSLINHFELSEGDTVLDPFVGSGTTMVEARLLGLNGVGIDICPLSSLISRAKSKFPLDTEKLENRLVEFEEFYDSRFDEFTTTNTDYNHEDILGSVGRPIPEFANHEKWFTPQAYLGSSITVEFIEGLCGYEKDFFACQLSSLMRSIGNVEVNVVRAEYSKKPRENVDVKTMLLKKCPKSIKDINNSIKTHGPMLGSSKSIKIFEKGIQNAKIEPNSVDAIITSPPYGVEAISYLRTHLLSYRSLANILEHDPYSNSSEIIGSEYIDKDSKAEHLASKYSETYTKFFKKYDLDNAPKKLQQRTEMMMKFFDDMALTAKSFKKWLRKGGKVAFVVGNKRLGDFIIPTHKIITEVFAGFGLIEVETIKHKLKTNNANSQVPWQSRIIQDEYILIFEKV